MPDIKSELAKLKDLKFDDPDEPETPTPAPRVINRSPSPENNLTRRIFFWFKANPASTVAECVAATGLTSDAVSARTAQLFTREVLVRKKTGKEPFRYTAAVDELPDRVEALKAALTKANEAKRAKAAQRKLLEKARAAKKVKAAKAAAKAAKAAKEAPESVIVIPTAFNAAMMVNGWTPFQAKAVFDELRKLFTGT